MEVVHGESYELFAQATGQWLGVVDQRGRDQMMVTLAIRLHNENATLGVLDTDTVWVHGTTDTAPRTWAINPVATTPYELGHVTTFVNANATHGVTLAGGAGVTLINVGTGTTGNFTIAARSACTAAMVEPDVWMVSGKGATNA